MIFSKARFSSLLIAPLGSLEPAQTSAALLPVLSSSSFVLADCFANLSKPALSSFALAAALSPKSDMPSSPLLIISKPDLAYLPTPGNLESAPKNKRIGPVTILAMAS